MLNTHISVFFQGCCKPYDENYETLYVGEECHTIFMIWYTSCHTETPDLTTLHAFIDCLEENAPESTTKQKVLNWYKTRLNS